jgi:hypothetical protein
VRGVLDVDDSPELVCELSVGLVTSPGMPISVVDNFTLVGNEEVSDDGVAMKGAVVRNVCWVVGTVDVITVGVAGLLH